MTRRPPRLGPGPRPSGGARYPRLHRNLAAQQIAEVGRCENPNGCPHHDAGTTKNPLTRDHPHPRARGGSHDQPDALVLCRRCNTAKGAT